MVKRVRFVQTTKPAKVPEAVVSGPEWVEERTATDILRNPPIEGGMVAGFVGGVPAHIRSRTRTEVTVAAADSTQEDIDAADFRPSMSGSDSDHWQAAIDQAHGESAKPIIKPLGGTHHWDGTVTRKNVTIDNGSRGQLTTRVVWDGAAGGTAMAMADGSTSFGYIAGIQFEAGDNEPEVWIDLRNSAVADAMLGLEWLKFSGGQYQIYLGTFVNAFWRRLRFDGWKEFAIKIWPEATQSLSMFHLDDFTADAKDFYNPTHASPGFMEVQYANTGVKHGTIHLSNFRMEFNVALPADPAGFIVEQIPNGSGGNFLFKLDGANIQDAHSSSNMVIVHRNAASGTVAPPVLSMTDFQLVGVSKFIGGDLNANVLSPAIPSNGQGSVSMNLPEKRMFESIDFMSGDGSTSILTTRKYDSSYDILRLQSGGDIEWGDGFSAINSGWGRVAHQRIGPKSGGVLRINSGTTAQRPSNTGNGDLYADTTLNKLICYIGGAWRDGSGTAV